MTVLIAGGGIGGLALALSLNQVGVPALVFESAAEPKALGVGINVLPHAVRELIELGLESDLDAIGVRTSTLAYFSKHGKPIWSEPRGMDAGYRWPQFSVHRGALTQLLWNNAAERLGASALHAGHHLHSWREADEGVEATFVDKASGQIAGVFRGNILVGADGIHSSLRASRYPDEGVPKWNGNILWRGVTFAPPFLDGRTMIMAGYATLRSVNLLDRLHKPELAFSELREALAKEPNLAVGLALARRLQALGSSTEAVKVLEPLLMQDALPPDHWVLARNAADLLAAGGRPDLAVTAYRRLFAIRDLPAGVRAQWLVSARAAATAAHDSDQAFVWKEDLDRTVIEILTQRG